MSSRDKKFLVIIGALVLLLIAVVIGVIVFFTGEPDEGTDKPQSGDIIITDNNQSSKTENEEPDDEDNSSVQNPDVLTEGTEVSTPCGIVFYPQEWENQVEIENIKQDGGEKIRFFAKIEGKEKMPLFDLNFGIAEGSRLGKVKVNGNYTDLYFMVYETEFSGSWTDEEINAVYSMQEGINNILAQLEIEKESSEAVAPSSGKVEIETPYGNLNFPGEWEEYLVTEVDSTGDYTVKFYAKIKGKNIAIFDISFGDETDSSLEKVKAKDGSEAWMNVTMHEIVPDDLNASEQDIVYGMQESFNDIVDDFIG